MKKQSLLECPICHASYKSGGMVSHFRLGHSFPSEEARRMYEELQSGSILPQGKGLPKKGLNPNSKEVNSSRVKVNVEQVNSSTSSKVNNPPVKVEAVQSPNDTLDSTPKVYVTKPLQPKRKKRKAVEAVRVTEAVPEPIEEVESNPNGKGSLLGIISILGLIGLLFIRFIPSKEGNTTIESASKPILSFLDRFGG